MKYEMQSKSLLGDLGAHAYIKKAIRFLNEWLSKKPSLLKI